MYEARGWKEMIEDT